jgi:hypothetical protein
MNQNRTHLKAIATQGRWDAVVLSVDPCWLPFVPRCQSRAPVWVQLWVHYGSNKRCLGLFSAL